MSDNKRNPENADRPLVGLSDLLELQDHILQTVLSLKSNESVFKGNDIDFMKLSAKNILVHLCKMNEAGLELQKLLEQF